MNKISQKNLMKKLKFYKTNIKMNSIMKNSKWINNKKIN